MLDLTPGLAERLFETRALSLELAEPLSAEDMVVQAMDDASPTKWHLGHVTWFFETFILKDHVPGYETFDPSFNYCFNSYYETQGARHPRPLRGLLTRPPVDRVIAYRRHVDGALERLMTAGGLEIPAIASLIEIGINHEQQHQELLLTDILALFAASPLRPAYREPGSGARAEVRDISEAGWISFDGGIRDVGHDGKGFCWDNELPRHQVLLQPFRLADRLVTNGEWRNFIEDGGYRDPLLWLSDGWASVQREGWDAPQYWEKRDDQWHMMTLEGLLPVDAQAPVSHVSYYEADAFARWSGCRLPTEFEWETAAAGLPCEGNLLARGALRPVAVASPAGPDARQMFGDVWEWTQSAYQSYPGYRPAPGAVGEYNGKFMVGQQVLRGASCVTPAGHTRATYRNFFYPHQRWQFMGVRLAKDNV
ncbi:MAG: ergothioneine biosynthesis protein EgtB [Hyphomicrobiaceae bacterium]